MTGIRCFTRLTAISAVRLRRAHQERVRLEHVEAEDVVRPVRLAESITEIDRQIGRAHV